MDCVAQHLALFSRFGYEPPVSGEAEYISQYINNVDSTIGWARFQEIVQGLRARRVLQGSRTLFFVPKALHIYLWKQFWNNYGRRFDFNSVFSSMPESLHSWFMSMFKYADGTASEHVIRDILKPDGVLAAKENIQSQKGIKFISILAEAHPTAVLRFLEEALESWTDDDFLAFREARQSAVWALEKIAVWPALTVRALILLSRFAANENSNYSNNSTGTLIGLFRIGPEMAVTEASPQERLPALIKLLSSHADAKRLLGLKAAAAALDSHGGGFRIIGPEYQGLRERAALWRPETYGEWWQAKLLYLQSLVSETAKWPFHMRGQAASALLDAVKQQVLTPPCTELAFEILDGLCHDISLPSRELNRFFLYWRQYDVGKEQAEIVKKLLRTERGYLGRSIERRFRRYVVDVDWSEWGEDFRQKLGRSRSRSKELVSALATRAARNKQDFDEIIPLLAEDAYAPALTYFGECLATKDAARFFLQCLISQAAETRNFGCLYGYLRHLSVTQADLHREIILDCLNDADRAWLGVALALRFDYDDTIFVKCLEALESGWVTPLSFGMLRYGRSLSRVPTERIGLLFRMIGARQDMDSKCLLVEMLDDVPFNDESPFSGPMSFPVEIDTSTNMTTGGTTPGS